MFRPNLRNNNSNNNNNKNHIYTGKPVQEKKFAAINQEPVNLMYINYIIYNNTVLEN